MKNLLLTLVLLLATGRTFAQLSAADETAIRHTVARMTTNFQNHTFADMSTYTTPDVSWVNIVGMWWRGRPAVQQAHQQIFDALFKDVAFTPGSLIVRGLTPEVALVNMYCHVGAFSPPDGVNRGINKEGDDDNLLTLVLVKKQGNWLLAAGHNTVVRASAQANNPVGKPTSKPSGATKRTASIRRDSCYKALRHRKVVTKHSSEASALTVAPEDE